MNTDTNSTAHDAPQQKHTDPWTIREEISQELAMAAFYANHAAGYADVGDDSGLAYGFQRLLDHVRAAARQHRQLNERKAANVAWWKANGERYSVRREGVGNPTPSITSGLPELSERVPA